MMMVLLLSYYIYMYCGNHFLIEGVVDLVSVQLLKKLTCGSIGTFKDR